MAHASTHYGIVLVTASSRSEADAIAHALIQGKLAACVSLMPITSIYTWQGAVEQSDEWQLIIKTNLDRFPKIESRVRDLHSYDVPEIIAIPILEGSPPYLNWISDQTESPPQARE